MGEITQDVPEERSKDADGHPSDEIDLGDRRDIVGKALRRRHEDDVSDDVLG